MDILVMITTAVMTIIGVASCTVGAIAITSAVKSKRMLMAKLKDVFMVTNMSPQDYRELKELINNYFGR